MSYEYDDPWEKIRQGIEQAEQTVAHYESLSGAEDVKELFRTIFSGMSDMESRLRQAGFSESDELADRCLSLQIKIGKLI
ncbi:MAG: NRDE family protein [Oscillospiraceae bacterium]|nr:NRDE family protein [Oscillospiraceae bacterium]